MAGLNYNIVVRLQSKKGIVGIYEIEAYQGEPMNALLIVKPIKVLWEQ